MREGGCRSYMAHIGPQGGSKVGCQNPPCASENSWCEVRPWVRTTWVAIMWGSVEDGTIKEEIWP